VTYSTTHAGIDDPTVQMFSLERGRTIGNTLKEKPPSLAVGYS
jgi:hypothetical protein